MSLFVPGDGALKFFFFCMSSSLCGFLGRIFLGLAHKFCTDLPKRNAPRPVGVRGCLPPQQPGSPGNPCQHASTRSPSSALSHPFFEGRFPGQIRNAKTQVLSRKTQVTRGGLDWWVREFEPLVLIEGELEITLEPKFTEATNARSSV